MPAAQRLPWGLAWRLAFGQIVAWGILYYTFTVVSGPIHDDTGWSRTFINVGLSIGLLAWGVLALPVGAWIQRRGSRELMTFFSALGGLALIVMGIAETRVAYIAAWFGLGAAMAGTLYDPAFAAITRTFGVEYRRGITLITLVGGLASTVFIPVAQYAVNLVGWRAALVLLGSLQVVIGVPLHLLGVPRHLPPPADVSPGVSAGRGLIAWTAVMIRDMSDPRFVGLALWFTAHAAAFTGLIFQFIPLFQSRGVPTSAIVTAIAFMGPLQVIGRFMLTTYGKNFSTLRVGRWAMLSLLVGLAILLVLPPTLLWLSLFAAFFGLGNGVMTIVRGTAIAELFGTARYPELNGALSAPAVLAKAAAPLALGAVWSATGNVTVVVGCVGLLLVIAVGGLYISARAIK